MQAIFSTILRGIKLNVPPGSIRILFTPYSVGRLFRGLMLAEV